MPPRAIVRHDAILAGRWCLDGTALAIAAIRADHALGVDGLLEMYAAHALTLEEVDAILAFDWPDIREVAVSVQHYAVTVHCVCGEDNHVVEAWPDSHVECLCGRQWEIAVSALLKGRSGITATVASR